MRTKNNLAFSSINFVLVELIGDVLYWPLWWYSKGLYKAWIFCLNNALDLYHNLAVGVWAKNLFVPMFGQYDWEGRIISFFVRLFQIVIRSIVLIIWTVFIFLFFVAWVFLPLYVFYQVIDNYKYLFYVGY